MNDNELADYRVSGLADVWERVADGRANDERLTVSGYQAHDTAQALRLAAARIRELSAAAVQLHVENQALAKDNDRLRADIQVLWSENNLRRIVDQRDRLLAAIGDPENEAQWLDEVFAAAAEVRAEMREES